MGDCGINSEDHVHTVRTNFYASNKYPDEISFHFPVGLLEPVGS